MEQSGSGEWASPGDDREPPPPPPPPEAMPQWAPIERAGGPTAGGGWQPPPPPRGGRSARWVLGLVGLILILAAAAVFAVQLRSDDRQDVTDTASESADVPASERDRALAAVLSTIDAAERRMIAFQDRSFLALEADPEAFGPVVSEEADDAASDLQDLREDLVLHARDGGDDFAGIRQIRDTYRSHLDAWIDYAEAVRGDPVLIRPDNPDSEPYWEDISTTADDFVTAMEDDLPEDAPQELVDRAEFILERGFGGGDGTGDLV